MMSYYLGGDLRVTMSSRRRRCSAGGQELSGVELAPPEQSGCRLACPVAVTQNPCDPRNPLSVFPLDGDARGDLSGLCRQLRGPLATRPQRGRCWSLRGPAGFALSLGGGCLASARLIKRTLAPGGAPACQWPANMSLPGAGPIPGHGEAAGWCQASDLPHRPPPHSCARRCTCNRAPSAEKPQQHRRLCLSSACQMARSPSSRVLTGPRGPLTPSPHGGLMVAFLLRPHGPSAASTLSSSSAVDKGPLFPAQRVLSV